MDFLHPFFKLRKRCREVTSANISCHLRQIENNGELHLSDCIKKIFIPSEQWDEQDVTFYNLDAVIAVVKIF